MDDLISRASAIEAIVFNSEDKSAVDVLNDVPAVDAAPVVHGRWIYHDDDIMPWVSCSECNVCTDSMNKTPYCPFCGAIMDG